MQETKDDAIRDKWAAAFGSGVTTLPVASRETSNPIYIRNDRLRYTIIGIVTVMIVSIVVTIVKSS